MSLHDLIILNRKCEELEEKLEIAMKALNFYADTEIYRRAQTDRNGMSGMSAQTDFEIEDGEWKLEDGEKDHYCYGKRARAALARIKEMENEE